MNFRVELPDDYLPREIHDAIDDYVKVAVHAKLRAILNDVKL